MVIATPACAGYTIRVTRDSFSDLSRLMGGNLHELPLRTVEILRNLPYYILRGESGMYIQRICTVRVSLRVVLFPLLAMLAVPFPAFTGDTDPRTIRLIDQLSSQRFAERSLMVSQVFQRFPGVGVAERVEEGGGE